MYKIVFMRHGESTWNLENRFTGWTDVDLTEKGINEARTAGRVLREAGFAFDVAYTSVLKRAIRTLWLALDEMDQMYLPIKNDWRLTSRSWSGAAAMTRRRRRWKRRTSASPSTTRATPAWTSPRSR